MAAKKQSRARKTSTKPTRIWTFSAVIENPAEAREILSRANRYYNALIEIERDRRTRFAAVRRQYAPELAALEDEWLRLDEQIILLYREAKNERADFWRATRGKKKEGLKKRILPEAFEARRAEIEAHKKAVSERATEWRKKFMTLVQPAREEFKRRTKELGKGRGPRAKEKINAQVSAAMLAEPDWHDAWKAIEASDGAALLAGKKARFASMLYGGTYQAIDDAVARAKLDSVQPPRFHRFDGTGKIRLQAEKGATWQSALRSHRRMSIVPIETRAGRSSPCAGTSARSRMVRLELDQTIPPRRAGANPVRSVVSATCRLHRVPPLDAEVKWVTLLVRRRGQVLTVEFQLTLEHESFAESKRPAGLREPEHIRIGWPRVAEGIRVAEWPGGGVVCPNSILDTHEYAESIEAFADSLREQAVRRICAIARLAGSRPDARKLVGDRQRIRLRLACEAYAQLVFPDVRERWLAWRLARKAMKRDLYAPIHELRRTSDAREAFAWWCFLWARKDQHLEQLVADLRNKAVNRRDALYRREAIRLATEFRELTIDNYSIADLKEKPELTMPGELPRVAAWQAQVAAPGRFRELLVEVMGGRCTPCERAGDEKKGGSARSKKNASAQASDEFVDAAE
jgi:hypothetical protein